MIDHEQEKMNRIKRASVRGGVNKPEGEGVLSPPSITKMTVRVKGESRPNDEVSIDIDPAEYVGRDVPSIKQAILDLADEVGFYPDDVNSSALEVFQYAELLALPEPMFGTDPDL